MIWSIRMIWSIPPEAGVHSWDRSSGHPSDGASSGKPDPLFRVMR